MTQIQLKAPCTISKLTLAIALALPALTSPITVLAAEEGVNNANASQSKLINFKIPAQPLVDALNAFISASDWQVGFSAELAKNVRATAVDGRYTPQQALERLLAGSGLRYRLTGINSVTLEKAPLETTKAEPTVLKTVSVKADAIRDVKDPYNEDYVLPDATAGTKTDTPIMETPLNVQVVSKQVLKDQQVINLGDALKNVSGVTYGTDSSNVTTGGTAQSITLRGFSSETYFRNGFRLQQGSTTREMANVESVEVLKGSGAVLYGQVEPGGMVNVITKQPLATPYYSAQQQFGSFNLYRSTIEATGPIADNKDVLYRMNLSYENSGSFQDFINNEKIFIAPVVKWNISDKTQATFELEYNHDTLGYANQLVPNYNRQLINIPRSTNYGEPGSKATNDTLFGSINWSHMFNDNWSVKHSMTANHTSLPSLAVIPFSPDLSATGTTIDRTLYQLSNENNTYATNLDLTGQFDTYGLKHTLLLGGDYYRVDRSGSRMSSNWAYDTQIAMFNSVHPGFYQNFDPSGVFLGLTPIPPGTPNGGLVIDPNFSQNLTYKNNNDQYGLYLQDQVKLPYNLHFTGGLRYQYIHQYSFSQYPVQDPSIQALSADKVTPRVGLLWQPQTWLSLYGNYTQNFGANIPVIIYPNGAPPPTSAEQWEVGAKTEFFDGRLRGTLAYYDLTKTNVVSNDPINIGYSILTGAVRSRGPELDIQGEILSGWNVIATYSNTDIIVTKGNTTVGNPDYPAVGSRYFGVPRNTASFWNTYEFQDPLLKGLKFGGGVTVRDGILGWGGDNINVPAPGYATVDLMSSYNLKIGHSKITAQLNVNNLLDKYYYTSVNGGGPPSAAGYSAAFVNFGMPRSLMGSIKVEF